MLGGVLIDSGWMEIESVSLNMRVKEYTNFINTF